MARKIILSVAVTVMLALTGVYALGMAIDTTQEPKTPQATPITVTQPPTTSELLKYTNIERKKAGVPPLTLDSRLNQTAQTKVNDMVKNNYYDHTNPKTGKRGAEYIAELSMGCTKVSENLNGTQNGAKSVVDDWMTSTTGHAEAIVYPTYDLVGFAVADDIVVQHFCDLP